MADLTATVLTAFLTRWDPAGGAERANYQSGTALLGHQQPMKMESVCR